MFNYDQLAQEYHRHRQVQPEVIKQLIAFGATEAIGAAGLSARSQVLEVGCGTGNYILAIQQAIGCVCCGIDPSQQMLDRAQARPGGLLLKQGRAEDLDFPAAMFDLVFSVDVIHHVIDRARYFDQAFQVLKPGGKLCTVTDSEEIIRQRQPLARYFPETVTVDLARYPATADLCTLMVQSGFVELSMNSVEFAYPLTDIQPYRDRAFSCLHLISDCAFAAGIQRMEEDLQQGPLAGVSRYLLVWGGKA